MTDNGYDNPTRSNGHFRHENGAANGRDADTTLMLLETPPLPVAPGGNMHGATDGVCSADDDAVPVSDGELSARDTETTDGAEAPEMNDSGAAEQSDEEAEARAAQPEFTDQDRRRHLRMAEALLFASAEPLRTEQIAERLPDGADVEQVLADLAEHYAERGVTLVRVAGGWAFRTATDLSFLMERERVEQRKLSRAALETLAIIAYHQPVTRSEIEDVRGVSVSKGTLDVLMEIGWVRVRGRRQTPGRPVTYGTSDTFLEHFGLDRVSDLPGLDELKAAGLLDTHMPTNISIPCPSDEDDPDDGDAESEEADLGYSPPDTEENEDNPCAGEAAEFDADAEDESGVEMADGGDASDADDLPVTEEGETDEAEADSLNAEPGVDGMEDGAGAGETAPDDPSPAAEADADAHADAGETVQPRHSRTA